MANNKNSSLEKTGTPVTRRSVAQAEKRADAKASKLDATQPIKTRTKTAGNTTKQGTANTVPVRRARRQDVNASQAAPKKAQPAAPQKVAASSQQATATSQQATKEIPRRSNGKNDSSVKDRVAAMDQKGAKKGKKKKPGKKATFGRSLMITLMVIYFIVVGIVGVWGVSQFFWFYVVEKSPVMAVNTPNSRVADRPDIEQSKVDGAREAILGAGLPIKDVTIRQVGPTLHFFVTVNDDADIGTAREAGRNVLNIFTEKVEQPELFATYEAQLIVTKDNLEELSEEVMLRPAGNDGAEQAFPQYGVSNKNTGGNERNISWSRNGE